MAFFSYICSMERAIINFDTVDNYNKLYGFTTRHPFVTVVNLNNAEKTLTHFTATYGLYALFLKNSSACTVRYGRRSYDYQEGTVVSFAPGQKVDVDVKQPEDPASRNVIGILFHPDLVYGTPLAERLNKYSFFSYAESEAVHLSEEERAKFTECIEKIDQELDHAVDRHSADIICVNIQVLLEYMERFYDRQFTTRHKVNSQVVAEFEKRLKEYFNENRSAGPIPGVAYFAEKANLSPGYFGDLIRKETGSSPKDLIALRLIDVAKQRLRSGDDDVAEIAYSLGFEYPAHFSRMFKRITGMSPVAYRRQENMN